MQYPLTRVGLNHSFMWINISQAVVALPLFMFAYYMYRWENSNLVPIRCVFTSSHKPKFSSNCAFAAIASTFQCLVL